MLRAISIGRGEGVDVSLDDPSVSRLHAELLIVDQNRYFLTDCCSQGGTRVARNDQWVPITQDYVFAGEGVMLGQYATTVSQLVKLAGGKGDGPIKDGEGGRKPLPQDALPCGPVRRDPETGQIISEREFEK